MIVSNARSKKAVDITSVESDPDSIKDASKNISSSPFSKQITLVEKRIQDFALESQDKFDLIVCNPPFFENHLKSDNKNTKAIHNDDLPYEDLVSIINKLLNEEGEAFIMYPHTK
ncbi:hypothetical protein DCC35_15665 [Mangrovivirga cuniculi]|uniref:Methyltransferase small domain-containing protein n=1 Tax=Mangrovivirga cuniculi TaxID=2715131 RepID=A0A4D7JZE3_9BACT|nr:hypothetical protein DCC35_15665 [Mangrovivirga cuniculi]